jgi:erythromycin esterase
VALRAIVVFVVLAFSAHAQPDAAFVEWARSRAVPVDSLQSLDGEIAAARLIGIGESFHESEPFLSFRVQLVKELVQRHKVTAIVFESGLPEVMAADDYVRGRTSTIDFAAAMPGGHGELQGMRELVEWIREWNKGPGRSRPVGLYGADLSGRAGSMVPALDRLEQLTAGDARTKALIDAIRPVATQIAARSWKPAADKYDALPAETKNALAVNVSLLADRVHQNGSDVARQVVHTLERSEECLRIGMFAPMIPRDRVLAENTLYVLNQLKADERAVYLAHNAHVQRAPVKGPALPPGSFPGSGMRFDAALGSRYLAIGTAYGGLSRDEKTEPQDGSIDATLGKVRATPFLLALRGRTPAWLTEERPMRFQSGHLLLPLGGAFDVVVYFDGATAAARAK